MLHTPNFTCIYKLNPISNLKLPLVIHRLSPFILAFNIGNPHNTVTVYDLAQRVIRACGSMSRITFVPLNFTDIELRIPDISKA
ncbi:hypothetical protein LCGC14_0409100, partial [marine sediment metagenome]